MYINARIRTAGSKLALKIDASKVKVAIYFLLSIKALQQSSKRSMKHFLSFCFYIRLRLIVRLSMKIYTTDSLRIRHNALCKCSMLLHDITMTLLWHLYETTSPYCFLYLAAAHDMRMRKFVFSMRIDLRFYSLRVPWILPKPRDSFQALLLSQRTIIRRCWKVKSFSKLRTGPHAKQLRPISILFLQFWKEIRRWIFTLFQSKRLSRLQPKTWTREIHRL